MTQPAHPGIVILGTPRSGTTLLRRILGAHPNIASMGESNLLSACARFLASERIAEDVEIGVVAGLGQAGFARAEVLARLREFAFGFHRDHASRARKPRWAEKTAFDAFHVPGIEAFCGEHAYFLCVVRHGLDVACSLEELSAKNGGYLGELHGYVQRNSRPLEAFTHAWVDMTRAIRAFAARHPQNALLLRYEDLVARPEAVVSDALRFVGEQFDPRQLDIALGSASDVGLGDWKTYARDRIGTESVGRWKSLSRWTISQLGAIANGTLRDCGYEPVPVEDFRDADEARRRYELGLLLARARKD
ncbi:MAG TPA: sulfotransferase [Steroidobacteraceae bacterium]|nr:sulfotransferase [Steroidobacteraceae bacterium]